MASNSITEKLYPPVIEGTLPAFYADNGTAIITVPFSLNRAVSAASIRGVNLKLKTIQSNTTLTEKQTLLSAAEIKTGIVKFDVSDILDKILLGQYLKAQIGFISMNSDNEMVTGYYSTVGVIKYTAKPTVSVINNEAASLDVGEIPSFAVTYAGKYEQDIETGDITEREYQYIFNLYNSAQELIQTSDWQLHDSSADVSENGILADTINSSYDTYSFLDEIEPYKLYFVQYGVRTINGLEVYSNYQSALNVEGVTPDLKADLIATNIFDDGCIKLTLMNKSSAISTRGSYRILRSSSENNYKNWKELSKVVFYQSELLSQWNYKDYSIEQGKDYQYALQQYNDAGLYSSKILSNTVFSDFEDMFLYDGERQLRIRFNPKVTSFKTTRLEQKIDTIGSKYPHFFRNGRVEYKEFPIAGLISYLGDENNLFMTKEELGLKEIGQSKRSRTPTIGFYEKDSRVPTNLLKDYNYSAERIFKLNTLDWLGNGEPKLFKSPAEGNYVVRLMNVSLSPEDKTSRLIHTFSATAYEIAPASYDSLKTLGFINRAENTGSKHYSFETVKLVYDNGVFLHGKINNMPIQGLVMIDNMIPGTFVMAGNEKWVIGQNGSLHIYVGDSTLPDLYIPADKDSNGAYLYNFQGQVTYRYATKASNSFNLVKKIKMTNEIKTHTSNTTTNLFDLYEQNVKKELFTFYSIQFYQKQIVDLYLNPENNRYYADTDYTILISNFEPDCIYCCHNEGAESFYTLRENDANNLIGHAVDISYSIIIDGEEFHGVPNLTLPNKEYTSIIFGNGICCTSVGQIKIITYEMEDTDPELLAIADKNSAYYLTVLERKIAEKKALQEEEGE